RRARTKGIQGLCGSVTWVQRFGGHLNLNVHFHALLPDGVFERAADGTLRFRQLDPPDDDDVAAVTRRIVRRVHALVNQHRAEDDVDAPPDAPAAAPAAGRAPARMPLARPDGDGEVPVAPRHSAFSRASRYTPALTWLPTIGSGSSGSHATRAGRRSRFRASR